MLRKTCSCSRWLHAITVCSNEIIGAILFWPPNPFVFYHFLFFFSSSFLYSSVISGKSKEAEVKRINKELANIRSKFKGDKTLDGYQKKKYVCKLLFIFLLGHDIDFGHMEAVNLLSSNKYSEKQIVSIAPRPLAVSETNKTLNTVFYVILGLFVHFGFG